MRKLIELEPAAWLQFLHISVSDLARARVIDSNKQVEETLRGVSAMILGIRGIEESSVYQDIFAKGEAKGLVEGRDEGRAEGRIEEARQAVQTVGRKKLGPPDEKAQMKIDDVDRLNALLERILDVASWDELLPSTDSQV